MIIGPTKVSGVDLEVPPALLAFAKLHGQKLAAYKDEMRRLVARRARVKFRKVRIPDGHSGEWRVERFSVSWTEAAVNSLREVENVFERAPRGPIPAGRYTKLCRGDVVVMSDVPTEMGEHALAYERARGDVLVNGLGLGMFAVNLLRKREVRSITVVELSRDVLALVAPHLPKTKRLRVLNADAFEWEPDRAFDCCWHDVWDDINLRNVPGMIRLVARYPSAWNGCWGADLLARNMERTLHATRPAQAVHDATVGLLETLAGVRPASGLLARLSAGDLDEAFNRLKENLE